MPLPVLLPASLARSFACPHQWLRVCSAALWQQLQINVQVCNQSLLLYHQQQCRSLATTGSSSERQQQQQQQQLTLKTALRQLYKRVHPDFFAEYPAEQAENERSFKLLQDYLHQARNPTTGPASRTAYHFQFFLLPQQPDAWTESQQEEVQAASDTEATEGGSAAAPGFELVQLVLVPPAPPRGSPQQHAGQHGSSSVMSRGAKQGLRKLLSMCGFSQVQTEDEDEEAQDASLKLTTFLPEAAEVVRQHESGPAKHETRVANMRAAFRLAHRVTAGFQPGAFTGEHQVKLLQRLASALDMLADDPPDLFGLRILICHRTGLDSVGVLCLDAGAEAEEWAAFLGGVDSDYARDKQASAVALRSLEGNVAAAMGVRMLFTAAPYMMTHEYRSFLERLAAYTAEHGPVGAGCTSSPPSASSSSSSSSSNGNNSSSSGGGDGTATVPVYVAPYYQHPGQQQQQQASVVHEAVGYIQVPMTAPAQEVYSIIQANAPEALRVLSRKEAAQQELAELSTSVRMRLNLRRLLKDELISMEEFRSACRRLLHHRDLLLRCNVEGLSVRVSDRNRVSPDGSLVDVAWNFDV